MPHSPAGMAAAGRGAAASRRALRVGVVAGRGRPGVGGRGGASVGGGEGVGGWTEISTTFQLAGEEGVETPTETEIRRFSTVSNGFRWFLLILIDFLCFSMFWQWFSLIFIGFH